MQPTQPALGAVLIPALATSMVLSSHEEGGRPFFLVCRSPPLAEPQTKREMEPFTLHLLTS